MKPDRTRVREKPNRVRVRNITAKLTTQELATIKRAADLAALPTTAYVRTRCLAEARRELSEVRPDFIPKHSRAATLAREALENVD